MKASPLGRAFSIFPVVAKRLTSSPALTLSVLVGLATAVALSAAIPMYSDAVHSRMLKRELSGDGPPFAVMYWYLGSNYKALDLEDVADVDAYITTQAPGVLDLPLTLSVRHMGTDNLRLFSAPGGAYEDKGDGLEWPAIGFINGVEDHVRVIEGAFPAATAAGEPIDVLAMRELAEQLGFHVGERYALVGETLLEGRKQKIEFPIRIAGIWTARDETEPFWFYRPSSFDKMLLVPEQVFVDRVASVYEQEVLRAVWYQVYEGSGVNIERVPQLQSAFRKIRTQVESRLPGATIAQSPEEAMDRYRLEAYHLMILLYVFSLPVVSLVLLFVGLVSQMVVDRQKNEIALLRSRGSSRMQVFGIYAFEGVLTGIAAAIVGLIAGRTVAAIMGRAESFLTFHAASSLAVRVTQMSLALSVGALALALLASLAPALSASRHTIVTYRRQTARFAGRPLWQRLFVDYALLLPVAYGYYTLSRRGTMGVAERGEVVGDPFQNPLLFLVPTLGLLSTALIFLRVFPRLMESLARASEKLRGASLLLALRSLARSSRHYTGPLLLLMLTVGLAAFTVTMARTLDRHLVDSARYQTGGDVRLRETGELLGEDAQEGENGQASGPPPPVDPNEEEPHWVFMPVFDYKSVPGVEAVTRVGTYKAQARWSARAEDGQVAGVDRDTLLEVTRLRQDYAPQPDTRLMQALDADPSAVLVQKRFFRENKLKVGDRIMLTVQMLGKWVEMPMLVAGVVDYFPTLYAEDGPFFIANLDYLFSQAGGLYHYDIWARIQPDLPIKKLEQGIWDLKLPASIQDDARAEIRKEQGRPERQGFYGLLSVGFVAAALVTALGFLIYSLVSFQRRSIELGMLRAIGLSTRQMIAYVAGEQLALVALGTAAGSPPGRGDGSALCPVPSGRVGQARPDAALCRPPALGRRGRDPGGVRRRARHCGRYHPVAAAPHADLRGRQDGGDRVSVEAQGPPADGPFIVCENLVKIYKIADAEVLALQGLDMTVADGELMAIVGSSGSGKSTLMNTLGGLDLPTAGRIVVDGQNLLRLSAARARRLQAQQGGVRLAADFAEPHPLSHGHGERRAADDAPGRAPRRDARVGAGSARPGRPGQARRAPPAAVVGRRAAARGDRGGPRQPAAPAAGRRADR